MPVLTKIEADLAAAGAILDEATVFVILESLLLGLNATILVANIHNNQLEIDPNC
jgi:hypothetical protein